MKAALECIAFVMILLLAGAADGLMDIGMGCFIAVSGGTAILAGVLVLIAEQLPDKPRRKRRRYI